MRVVPFAPRETERTSSVRLVRATPAASAETLRAAIGGDREATSRLFREHASLVRSVLSRALGPGRDVDDATQETFLRLFDRLPTLRDPGALRSFVIGVALRVASAELRRRRVRRWLSLTDDGATPDVRDERLAALDGDAREAVVRLYALLDRVADDERLYFVMRHLEELELTEIGEALDVSLATVKRKLAKVHARLAAMAARDPVLRPYFASWEEER